MNGKILHQRIIFGLKIKQLRTARGLSFADMAQATNMSISYLNEIEKGKKFPKPDKITALAATLSTTEEALLSNEMGPQLAPVTELLQSNFLNELPLEMFGIELGKVAEIIANAPLRVGAFISALLDISRSYALREENFFFAALRAYLELNQNYFDHIEKAVAAFSQAHEIGAERPLAADKLREILTKTYQYTVVENGLDSYAELSALRSVFLPQTRELLLNSKLTAMQTSFQLGKEVAFQYLDLKERAYTSSLLRGRVFQEVLNHAFATYFSVALHLPKEAFIADVARFFALPQWDGAAFLAMMQRYDASPEMFYHRLTNVLPHHFQLSKLFFLRVLHDPQTDAFEIDRELHLSKQHQPHGNALKEHYCRRWVSMSLLHELDALHRDGQQAQTLVHAQRSQYFGTDDAYLCITLARSGAVDAAADLRSPQTRNNVSVTLGLLINKDTERVINWIADPAIQGRVVNRTCERCAITDCAERAAPPTVVQKREKLRAIEDTLNSLL